MNKLRINSPEMQNFEKEHIDLIRKLAPECMVLLKNNGLLPLEKPEKIALYGSGARNTIKGGTGSGDVNVRHLVSVEEGLEKAGFEVTTKEWLDSYDALIAEAKAAFYEKIRLEAEALGANPFMYAMGRTLPEPEYDLPLTGEGELAIYVLSRNSGEGDDRKPQQGDINLTATEIRDICKLNKLYSKFVLLLNVGGMVNLAPVDEVETILLMGQVGIATGDSVADVLLGKNSPSGKLTMTWTSIQDYPSTEGFADPNDTDYKEGIYVGYRYFDTVGYQPVYPFGYGKTYTEFEIVPEKISADASEVTVSVSVTNKGNFQGKEVVQVYYSAPSGKLDKPYQELAGYEKTKELLPGETDKLQIVFKTDSMASYDSSRAAYILEEGTYYIRVGNSSRNTTIAGAVKIDGEVVVEKCKNICGESGFEDLVPTATPYTYPSEAAEKENAEVIVLCAKDFSEKVNVYSEMPEEIPAGESISWKSVVSGEKSIEDFVAGLSEEQLAYLCVGDYIESDDLLEVIGNASCTVAGAAGETTNRLRGLDLPSLVMADGPAGLRLSQEYRMTETGAKAITSNMVSDFMSALSEEEVNAMTAGKADASEDDIVYYQYCAAIPIGTELAQSFNKELLRTCGDIIGKEMEIFGVHIWLAPAMNIHRSPLCGRNFEYYSEDPLVSGIAAAEITKGVQSHEGCATTIKHYACNNQETNRYFSNSKVSERALREIYLKGFEICLKDAKPDFLMTSYNLINGEHACNRIDLQTYTLRDEWGFEGTVMTDWLVTGGIGTHGEKWPCASAAGNIKAGNDLTMPGIPSDKQDILNALNNKEHAYPLTKGELQLAAVRILKMIKKLYNN